jgi:hypothetical protein
LSEISAAAGEQQEDARDAGPAPVSVTLKQQQSTDSPEIDLNRRAARVLAVRSGGLSSDERAELQRLRDENATLRVTGLGRGQVATGLPALVAERAEKVVAAFQELARGSDACAVAADPHGELLVVGTVGAAGATRGLCGLVEPSAAVFGGRDRPGRGAGQTA